MPDWDYTYLSYLDSKFDPYPFNHCQCNGFKKSLNFKLGNGVYQV